MIAEAESTRKKFASPTGVQDSSQGRTLFIEGIPTGWTEQVISDYLSGFDIVESILFSRDLETGTFTGCAKVVLKSSKGVDRVLAHSTHVIDSFSVGISQWCWRFAAFFEGDMGISENKKLYVKYPPDTPAQAIRNHFLKFGPILTIHHKREATTNKDRNFCYVTFETVESAMAALKRRVHWVWGKLVVCELSKPALSIRKSRPPQQKYQCPSHNLDTSSQIANLQVPVRNHMPHESHPEQLKECLKSSATYAQSRDPWDRSVKNQGKTHNQDQLPISHYPRLDTQLSILHPNQFDNSVMFQNKEPSVGFLTSIYAKPTSFNYPSSSTRMVESNHLNEDNIRFTVQID